jgi:hypothetical protein
VASVSVEYDGRVGGCCTAAPCLVARQTNCVELCRSHESRLTAAQKACACGRRSEARGAPSRPRQRGAGRRPRARAAAPPARRVARTCCACRWARCMHATRAGAPATSLGASMARRRDRSTQSCRHKDALSQRVQLATTQKMRCMVMKACARLQQNGPAASRCILAHDTGEMCILHTVRRELRIVEQSQRPRAIATERSGAETRAAPSPSRPDHNTTACTSRTSKGLRRSWPARRTRRPRS